MFWKRIWPVLLLALALIGCTEGEADPVPGNSYAAEDFVVADGFLTYDGDAPSYVGVDVSSYQGEIDWERVAEAGVDFAMVRLGFRGYTEGGLYEDDRFRENLEGAMAAGLDVGVYFFSQAVTEEEAREEARFVLERLEGYDITYPVVFDWERQSASDSRTLETDGAAQTACAAAFCQAIEEQDICPWSISAHPKRILSWIWQHWYNGPSGWPTTRRIGRPPPSGITSPCGSIPVRGPWMESPRRWI